MGPHYTQFGVFPWTKNNLDEFIVLMTRSFSGFFKHFVTAPFFLFQIEFFKGQRP